MKIIKITTLLLATYLLAACQESSKSEDMESAIDLYMESIPFTDANLQQCIANEIVAQGITTSKELMQITCDQPLVNVQGLHYFSNIHTVDLTKSGTDCLTLHELQIQINEREAIDDPDGLDDTLAVITQPAGCFFNEISFADQAFKACLADEISMVGATTYEEVTYLACDDPAIVDISGLENFTALTEVILDSTAVSCVDIQGLGEALPDAIINSPARCSVSAIEFSEPLQVCVDAQKPTDLVLDFKALTCPTPELEELTGLEYLTSLETLDLTNTNVNCDALYDLTRVLLNTDITEPVQCQIVAETPLLEIEPRFEDSILAGCVYKKGNELATLVGDIEKVFCGGATVDIDKELTSIWGVENLTSLNSLNINATKVDNLQALKWMTSLVKLELFNVKRLDNIDMAFIHNELAYLTDLNIGGATGMKDYSTFNNMTNLNFLGIANQNLTGVDDLGTIPQLTQLKKLNIKANALVSLEALYPLVSLTSLDVSKNPALTCEQVQAFKDQHAIPEIEIIHDIAGCNLI